MCVFPALMLLLGRMLPAMHVASETNGVLFASQVCCWEDDELREAPSTPAKKRGAKPDATIDIGSRRTTTETDARMDHIEATSLRPVAGPNGSPRVTESSPTIIRTA